AYGAAVQQLPGFAVGIYGPTADNACIEEIETLLARPVDLPAVLGDQHRLALMYGDLRWANLDFEWHSTPPYSCSPPALRGQRSGTPNIAERCCSVKRATRVTALHEPDLAFQWPARLMIRSAIVRPSSDSRLDFGFLGPDWRNAGVVAALRDGQL